MNGQGRPLPLQPMRLMSLSCLCALLWHSTACQAWAETTSVRVHIQWSGPEKQIWDGSIRLASGRISDLRLLGLDADQPGNFVRQDEGHIRVAPRFANQNSGFEGMLSGELTDTLRIQLSPQPSPAQIRPPGFDESFRLEQILKGKIERDLGNGFKLRITRTAGDQIRIRFPTESMVFSPGERPKIDFRGTHLDAKPGATLRARLRLREDRELRGDVSQFLNQMDDGLWTRTETIRVDEYGQTPALSGIEIPLPDREGSYNLTIDFSHRLPAVGTVARRTVQLVIVDPQPPRRDEHTSKLVTELHPADPNWRRLLSQSNLLSVSKKGPWSNVEPDVWQHDNANWTRIQQGGWAAYLLSNATANVPHILDIEFPPGIEQDIGVSIVEPKANNGQERHVDTGLTVGDQDLPLPSLSTEKTRTHHRIVFWPKTQSPVVVLSNRSRKGAIAFGKIRLEAFPQGLPSQGPTNGRRKRIAVLDGAMLQTIFQADRISPEDQSSSDSWRSFLLAGQRLVEYLRFAGYDGATIDVASQGSTLYPSQFLLATPKFDQGILSNNRRDPFQKDVLELLLRLFDRENLALIPSLEFGTPLMALESTLANGPRPAEGIELRNASQRLGSSYRNRETGIAPYYNPLDPRVQRAMGRVVHELVKRCSSHDSFQGINIDCRADGFSQLPGAAWALDRTTVKAFHSAQQRPGTAWTSDTISKRLIQQLNTETESELTRAWLQWRADRISTFYQSVAGLLGNRDRTLFLSITDLMHSQPWQRQLRPALPRQATVQGVLLQLGVDIARLQRTDHVVLLRPNRIDRMNHLGSQAVNLELNEQDIQQSLSTPRISAGQYQFESKSLQLEAFDSQGPSKRQQHQFIATSTPAGTAARRHLASGLAQHDDYWIFEGGETLPFGQEKATQAFFDVFRQLPKRRFEIVPLDKSGPIVTKRSSTQGETIAYFVNTSPWLAQTEIQWQAPPGTTANRIGKSSIPSQAIQTQGDQSKFSTAMEPYSLLAMRFDSEDVRFTNCQTKLPDGIAQQLDIQLDEVVSRGRQIESQRPIKGIHDPGFEKPIGDPIQEGVVGWTARPAQDGNIQRDFQVKAVGGTSLRLQSDQANTSLGVVSNPFAAPETGRLVVSLKLRTSSSQENPSVVLRLESTDSSYRPFHLFDEIALDAFGDAGVSFVDLPTNPELRLRISLELVGRGEVWIDDIQMFDKWILDDEKKDLKKIIQRSVTQASNGNLAGCYQTLSGYWPRFLLRHIPPAEVAAQPLEPALHERNRRAEKPSKKSNRRFDLRRFVPLLR